MRQAAKRPRSSENRERIPPGSRDVRQFHLKDLMAPVWLFLKSKSARLETKKRVAGHKYERCWVHILQCRLERTVSLTKQPLTQYHLSLSL